MVRALAIAAVVLAGTHARASFAAALDGEDMTFASGVVIGKVTQERPDGSSQSFSVGGIPFAAMLNRDLAEHWTGSVDVEVLLDVVNREMIRQGFSGAMSFHVLGGARRLVRGGDAAGVVSRSSHNLSLMTRGGVFNYAATSKSTATSAGSKLSGGVWELAAGAEYRQDLSERSAVGIDAMSSLLTLPASVDRLSTNMREVLLFLRVFL